MNSIGYFENQMGLASFNRSTQQASQPVPPHESMINLRPFKVSLLTLLVTALTGCLWHGKSVDHVWGPTLFRVTTPPDSQAFLAEQIWMPLLVEGGTRWGLTIGYFSKFLSIPVALQQADETVDEGHLLSWNALAPLPIGSWRISPFHVSFKQERETEFIQKRIIGMQLSIGLNKEGSNITLGISRTSLFWPHPDALYLLEFSGRYPLRTRFLVCDAKENESLEPCLREVIQ